MNKETYTLKTEKNEVFVVPVTDIKNQCLCLGAIYNIELNVTFIEPCSTEWPIDRSCEDELSYSTGFEDVDHDG